MKRIVTASLPLTIYEPEDGQDGHHRTTAFLIFSGGIYTHDGQDYGWGLAGEQLAIAIDEPVRGFQGFRYRWWDRRQERPFPDWQEP